jgi:pectate lyase
MKKVLTSLLIIVVLLIGNPQTIPTVQAAIPAFPGAQGYGATTPGGRGGKIIEVTNLNDSGNGSLRAAIESSGARIVVFRVSGMITLTRGLDIKNPFITIAGQTSPGGGITLRGGDMNIYTHDVIIRGIRMRVGDEGSYNITNRDGLQILNGSQNVVIDHSSFSWAIDENASTWYPVNDVTFQWNIVSEGLHNSKHEKGAHSMGFLIGEESHRISVHHNLFAHNNERNPRLKHDTHTEVINNVMYNWGGAAIAMGGEGNAVFLTNIINNQFISGTNSRLSGTMELVGGMSSGSKIYIKGNRTPQRTNDAQDDWIGVSGDTTYRVNAPGLQPSGITIDSVSDAYTKVLAQAGANIPYRDSVDVRVVDTVKNKTGRIIDSQRDVGGWPTLPAGTPPLDTDHDGMPDTWEQSKGLNPTSAADANTTAPSGYTWIEEYINSFFSTNGQTPTPRPSQTPTPIPTQQHCQPLGDMSDYPNCKGSVNSLDLSYLLSKWDTTDFKANLDNQGKVNSLDLTTLLPNLGK